MTFLRRLALQWALLTRLPLPASWVPPGLDDAPSLSWAPLVGGVLGLGTGACGWLLARSLPPLPAAWGTCGLYALAGWALHLDGWSDLADGFGSGRRGEALREVMKDSRIGGFGALALVWGVGMWSLLLAQIPASRWPLALAFAGATGRFALCVAAWRGVYPWESGMGRCFVREYRGAHLALALLLAAPFLLPFPGGTPLSLCGAALAGLGMAGAFNRRMGGVNGDVLGGAEVLGELIALGILAS